MSELDEWQEFSEYLVDQFTKAGFADQDAKDKAKDFNIWPQLGFSFEELKSGCFDHFSKMDRGECIVQPLKGIHR